MVTRESAALSAWYASPPEIRWSLTLGDCSGANPPFPGHYQSAVGSSRALLPFHGSVHHGFLLVILRRPGA